MSTFRSNSLSAQANPTNLPSTSLRNGPFCANIPATTENNNNNNNDNINNNNDLPSTSVAASERAEPAPVKPPVPARPRQHSSGVRPRLPNGGVPFVPILPPTLRAGGYRIPAFSFFPFASPYLVSGFPFLLVCVCGKC